MLDPLFFDGEVDEPRRRSPHAVYQVILETAAKIGADLIVMASHRPKPMDYLLGPNAAKVVRHAKTSVLVVR